MKLVNLLKQANIPFHQQQVLDHDINKISINSKDIRSDDLFIAIKGANHDGHHFIDEAVLNGCKTVLFEDPYYTLIDYDHVNMIRVFDSKKALSILSNLIYDQPSKKMNLVGVTGTNGKTTITSLIYNIYTLLNTNCTLLGTNGIYINKEFHESPNTTPNALVINEMLQKSLDEQVGHAILEVSSHSVKEQRISQLDINTMIYTNFSLDHLDYHKTFDDYFYNKVLSFAYLGSCFNDKLAILNGDDPHFKSFLNFIHVKHYTYGLADFNDFRARNIICEISQMSFDFYYRDQLITHVKTKSFFGFFNIYNLLAALSYFYLNGYNINDIIERLGQIKTIKGRFDKVKTDHPIEVFIDYAHTPKSVYKILQEVKLITNRKIITVIGCGGDRDQSKRPIIGKIVTSLSDYTIFTDDNPRKEDSSAILNDIVKGVVSTNYILIPKREEAICHAINSAENDEIVLILGKGHEEYQMIQNKKFYFNDYNEALKYIELRFKEE